MARRNLLSQTEAQSQLVQQISQTIRDHQGGTVSASALFPFTWERLCIFTWADKLSSVNPALGVEWVVPDDQMIGSGEGYTLPDYQIAVFVESGSVVQHLIFPEYPFRDSVGSIVSGGACVQNRPNLVFTVSSATTVIFPAHE